jgi:hypothetical protein
VQYSTINCAEGPDQSPLPVRLTAFNARRNKSTVQLTWETVTESMNKGFNIERRTGNSGWETLGFVNSKADGGNSTALLTYSYSDVNTYSGVSQYRLRQVDMDGKASYSDIRSVRGEQQAARTILYPNPSSNGIVNVVFEGEGSTHRDIILIDISGRVLNQWKGYTNNSLQLESLRSGMYTLRIVDKGNGTQLNEKVIVNRK